MTISCSIRSMNNFFITAPQYSVQRNLIPQFFNCWKIALFVKHMGKRPRKFCINEPERRFTQQNDKNVRNGFWSTSTKVLSWRTAISSSTMARSCLLKGASDVSTCRRTYRMDVEGHSDFTNSITVWRGMCFDSLLRHTIHSLPLHALFWSFSAIMLLFLGRIASHSTLLLLRPRSAHKWSCSVLVFAPSQTVALIDILAYPHSLSSHAVLFIGFWPGRDRLPPPTPLPALQNRGPTWFWGDFPPKTPILGGFQLFRPPQPTPGLGGGGKALWMASEQRSLSLTPLGCESRNPRPKKHIFAHRSQPWKINWSDGSPW